ncbi:MAG: energy transducer TonB [Verrucomicrobiota bacterium]
MLALLALAGCATAEKVMLQPVDNPIAPTPTGVYDISQVKVMPTPTHQSRPRYPFELRKAGISGEAVTIFTVKTDGTVADASTTKATDIRFGEAAVESVLKWRFRPAQVDGVPVNCRMMVPIVFELNND